MRALLVFFLTIMVFPVFAQNETLGLTQEEFEDVFVDSEEYTKIVTRLYDLENNEDQLLQKINALEQKVLDLEKQSFESLIIQYIFAGSTIAVVITTVVMSVLTRKETKNQNKILAYQAGLHEKELEQKHKADLRVILLKTINLTRNNGSGKLVLRFIVPYIIRNYGSVEAFNIKIHHKIYDSEQKIEQIVKDENEIKSTEKPVEGSILQGEEIEEVISKSYPPKEIKPKMVALWIEYSYEDKTTEIVFRCWIKGGEQQREIKGIHPFEELQEIRERKPKGL